jgi:hypothetical protein
MRNTGPSKPFLLTHTLRPVPAHLEVPVRKLIQSLSEDWARSTPQVCDCIMRERLCDVAWTGRSCKAQEAYLVYHFVYYHT